MMKIYFIVVAVLSCLHHTNGDGKAPIAQVVGKSDSPLVVSNIYSRNILYENYSEKSTTNASFSSMGVVLPDLPCTATYDCRTWDDPYLICVDGQCTCEKPFCWVYHYESGGWSSRNVFDCDICGQLGSWCNETYTCDPPGECWKDGYCHCPEGEHYDHICIVVNSNWMYEVILGGLGIIVLFAFIIIAFHLWKNRPWMRPGRQCCGLCKKGGTGPRGRRSSCEKSPAFTIQNLYASQVFSISVDSPQIPANSEVGASTIIRQERSRTLSSTEEVANTSLTSVDTVTTSLSDTGIVNGPPDDESLGACSLQKETLQTSAINVDTRAKTANAQRSWDAVSISESSSISSSSSCTHERCKLCLPKGLSTRPTLANSPQSSSSITSKQLSSCEMINQEPSIPINLGESSKSLDFDCTHL